ncbi:MAG: SDR family NAD(P)-dependent oxidoreductase [Anaerolineae bacterium]|nr:SDR family NAD(P)-dependent oxidoreductase [Anaerolineae bacterium]MCO5207827.1 SDR family NAD(P)-dependent oxidoreductase [Anaerolineae bacterium]
MQVANCVVVVTGASAGIGRATATVLAEKGAHVVVVARRAERLETLVAELASFPGERLALAGDLSDTAFCQAVVEQTVAHFGRIDILINNAGLGHKSYLADLPLEHARAILDVNVLAVLATSQAAIPHMRRQGRGQIINISSILSARPLPNTAFYSASKSMVTALTRGLRMELRNSPIVVTTIYPGTTQTEFHDSALGGDGTGNVAVTRVSAEKVARKIVNAVEKGRTEVTITPLDWAFVHLNRLFPRLGDWVVGLFLVKGK